MAAPMIVPAHVLGGEGRAAPSERITMGVVGWGMMGPGNTDAFLNQGDCQVVAACDLDTEHLAAAVNTINGKYGNKNCTAYADYREMMARKDIDAVMLALPDNWHALTAVAAAEAKKDIYGEKPLARTIAEQQAIVKAVESNQRIWQTGSWQRSVANFHFASEIVRNGLIGKVRHVEVGLPGGHTDFAGTGKEMSVTSPPANLNYDMWLGPAQKQPYIKGRVHMNWRWDYNVGGGQLLDWIGHHNDIAIWALDLEGTGPIEIEAKGEFPAQDAVWNSCTKYWVDLKYEGGLTMTLAGGHDGIRGGTKWIGSDGWVWVDRGGFDTSIADLKDRTRLPDELRKVKLYESRNHHRNFLDCVKSRKPTITPVQAAHHAAIPGHLGLISLLTELYRKPDHKTQPKTIQGQKLTWDPKKEVIVGNAEASKLLTRGYRAPWKMP